jgi:predicted RNA-binding Zn-ribbon protein involved in translation (DUF1610 family)
MLSKNGNNTPTSVLPIASAIVLVLFLIVGGYAMVSDSPENAYSHYRCPICQTIVPCPVDHLGVQRLCPSCGALMDLVSKKSMAKKATPFAKAHGANGFGANGFGANGMAANGTGRGAGHVGNLVCATCGTLVPHRAGTPFYQMQCPKCGNSLQRQTPANVPTAFYTPVAGTQLVKKAPPITPNLKMRHVYRGVCSQCHHIVGATVNPMGMPSRMTRPFR